MKNKKFKYPDTLFYKMPKESLLILTLKKILKTLNTINE